MRGSCSNVMPGGCTRFGPAQLTGLARSAKIGSVRTAASGNCRRKLEWPMNVTANSPGPTDSGGGGYVLFLTVIGHDGGRFRKTQRNRPPKDGWNLPSRLRNFVPIWCSGGMGHGSGKNWD